MMKFHLLVNMLLLGLLCFGCSDAPAPGPLKTVSKILNLHALFGRDSRHRTDAEKKQVVKPDELFRLFKDYGKFDPFLSDLYVGFVVGALARYQDRLVVEKSAQKATLTAGQVTVVMHLGDMGWQVDLGRSVPEAIKAKARLEQARLSHQMRRGR